MKSDKNLGINIDPQEPILSISDTFRAIWALRKKRHPKNRNIFGAKGFLVFRGKIGFSGRSAEFFLG